MVSFFLQKKIILFLSHTALRTFDAHFGVFFDAFACLKEITIRENRNVDISFLNWAKKEELRAKNEAILLKNEISFKSVSWHRLLTSQKVG